MGLWALDCEQEGGVAEHEPHRQVRRDPDPTTPEVGGWGVSRILAEVGLGQ